MIPTQSPLSLDRPTLYLAGSHDTAAPPEAMRDLASRTPHAQFVEIPAAAHIANIENAAAFNSAVCDFLGAT